MLTIYGVYRSRASRVYWLAEELGIDFQSVPVIQAKRLTNPLAADAPINTLSPDFTAINPMGMIPSIRDGALIMHESLAITLYLARKHGGPLSGKTVDEDGLLTMWTVWAVAEVEPHTVQVVRVYDNGQEGSEVGKEIVAVAIRSLKTALATLEAHLSANEWLVGGRFTVADLNLAEVLRYIQTEASLFATHPHIDAWIKRCQSRPAYLEMQRKRSLEPVEV